MLAYESVPSETVRVQTQGIYLLVISENVSQKAMDKGKKDLIESCYQTAYYQGSRHKRI